MKTVLVVDDDPEIRALLTWKLARAGYATLTAGDGATGVAAATSGDSDGRAPDIILVDWIMPTMSGIEVCRALRDNPATASIPVILLTSKDEEDEIVQGFAAGADDYILKPFSSREMMSRLHAVLTRCEART